MCSYGIILCYIPEPYKFESVEFLVCHRKDSLWYSEFLRGHLEESKLEYYLQFVTVKEKQNLLDYCDDKLTFGELWYDMTMSDKESKFYSRCEEYIGNLKKDGTLKLYLNKVENKVDTYVEFPKGRKEHNEDNLHAALREFVEESKIGLSYVNLIDVRPIVYQYTGTDDKTYTNHYYLAITNKKVRPHCIEHKSKIRRYIVSNEVSRIEWKKFEDCTDIINEDLLRKIKYTFDTYHTIFEDKSIRFKRKPFIQGLKRKKQ